MAPLLLYQVTLAPHHAPTGRTRHFADERQLPPPSVLRIVKYPEDQGFYLLYLDAYGQELTDTYHDSLEGAMAQAEFEFQVKPSDWKPNSEQ